VLREGNLENQKITIIKDKMIKSLNHTITRAKKVAFHVKIKNLQVTLLGHGINHSKNQSLTKNKKQQTKTNVKIMITL
jgi:hypothetical protein